MSVSARLDLTVHVRLPKTLAEVPEVSPDVVWIFWVSTQEQCGSNHVNNK